MSSGYVLSRDWIKGIQLHRITERTVAIFTFFPTSFVEKSFGGTLMCCSIGRREVLYDSRIMKI